jgi:hypothetical protein
MSDNVSGDADNQQERLAGAEAANWFLAGFIEGEGSADGERQEASDLPLGLLR